MRCQSAQSGLVLLGLIFEPLSGLECAFRRADVRHAQFAQLTPKRPRVHLQLRLQPVEGFADLIQTTMGLQCARVRSS